MPEFSLTRLVIMGLVVMGLVIMGYSILVFNSVNYPPYSCHLTQLRISYGVCTYFSVMFCHVHSFM